MGISNFFRHIKSKDISKSQIGGKGEKMAEHFLKKRGMSILHRNYRINHLELDLIARDKEHIVFVEVKTSRTDNFGHPAEWVYYKKRKNLIRAARLFLRQNNLYDKPSRFDIVAIKIIDGKTNIDYYPDAFPSE